MSLSALGDPSNEPTAEELASTLGQTAELWRRLIDRLSEAHGELAEVWNFAGPKYGWALRLKRKDRIVAYLIPQAGHFLVGLVLGERAYQLTHSMHLPEHVRQLVDDAPKYAEGRGFRVPVLTAENVEAVALLVSAKLSS